MPGMAELRQRIRLAANDAGGYRALARRSGNLVSHSTLNNLVNGRHSGKITDERMQGVALALGISTREVAAMIGRRYVDPPPPFIMPDRAHRLTQPQRRVVLSVVDAILTAADQPAASADAPTERQARRLAVARTQTEPRK